MNRHTVEFDAVQTALDRGWFVAWIGRSADGMLLVDFFANWRLPDQKTWFVQCADPGRRMFELWSARALCVWQLEFRRMTHAFNRGYNV